MNVKRFMLSCYLLTTILLVISGCDQNNTTEPDIQDTGPWKISETGYNINWSDDGKKISFLDNNCLIQSLKDGSRSDTLLNFKQDLSSYWVVEAVLSPNNRMLAFSSFIQNDGYKFYIYNFTSQEIKRLRLVSDQGSGQSYGAYYWFRDSKKIAFWSGGDVCKAELNDNGNWLLTQLTHRVTSNYSLDPTWSYDGNMIAYTYDEYSSNKKEIKTMNSDGSNQKQITSDGWRKSNLSWHPQSNKIAFIWEQNSENTFGLLNLNSGQVDTVKIEQGRIYEPAWSPDGKYIALRTSGGIWVFSSDNILN